MTPDERLWSPPPQRVVDGATSYLGLAYATVAGYRPLLVDLHLPADAGNESAPIVIYAHGGGFVGGTRDSGPWYSLPSLGIAVASIDYRLAGEGAYPDPVADVRAAIDWVQGLDASWRVDSKRLAVWGSSAGAYLVAQAALTNGSPVAAVILNYPVTDFAALLDDSIRKSERAWAGVVGVVERFFGRPVEECADVVGESSLIRSARECAWLPKFHLFHGDSDSRCGVEQSHLLHEALESLGGASKLTVVSGADHGDALFMGRPVVSEVVETLTQAWSE